ncbi:MAG: hypothetical protein Q8R12_04830 [bacterium]|nr:hypothetical protein [bacterium]
MARQKPKWIIVKRLSKGKEILLLKTQPWATKKIAARASLRPQERRGR